MKLSEQEMLDLAQECGMKVFKGSQIVVADDRCSGSGSRSVRALIRLVEKITAQRIRIQCIPEGGTCDAAALSEAIKSTFESE